MKKNSVFLLLFFSLFSCTNNSFDSIEELYKYIDDQDNGYKYTKTVNGVVYTLTYRPTDLVVNQELNQKRDEKQVETLRNQYAKYMYFTLSMSYDNKELLNSVAGDKAKFGQMVNELAFGMEEKVNIFTPDKDTLTMADFIYPRMYGMSNSTSVLIVYPRDEKYLKSDFLNFTIEDLGFYTGEVRFKLKTKAIIKEPQLIFD